MTTVTLGSLGVQHRAALTELLRATGAFSAAEVDVALELFDTAIPERPAPRGVQDYEFIAAFDGNESLVGYACFGPTPATDRTFDLYWLAVHPRAQRNGVGRLLVEHVEAELRERSARLLVVETSSRPDYAATRAFYAQCGYDEAARVRDFYAPADDRIIFTTRLTSERGVATP